MHRCAAALALALLAAACGPTAPAEPPVVVDASRVESEIHWASDLARRQVAIDGYLGFDNGKTGQGIAIGQVLTTLPGGQGRVLLRIDAPLGTGPGQLDLPVIERHTAAGIPNAPEVMTVDLTAATWGDAAGGRHTLRKKVRVTGRLDYLRVGRHGLWSEEDPRSPTGRRLKALLFDVTLDAPPSD